MNSKIYRCGWCGCPTDCNGNVLDELRFKKVVNIINTYGDGRTEKTHGQCCESENQLRNRVTRDMAIDAGDPSLEGEWI